MEITFRKATAVDAPSLIALARDTVSATHRSFLGDEAVNDFINSGASDQYVRDHLSQCWVLEVDGRILGYAVCKRNLIDAIMVDPAHHRRGLGTRLLRHCEDMLFERFAELTLESFEGNQPAANFYRKNGWVEAQRYFDAKLGFSKIVYTRSRYRS